MGRTLKDRDARGFISRYKLDSMGRARLITNPLGGQTFNVFNPAGELTQTRNPLGYSERYNYDLRGWLDSMVDPRDFTWDYRFDAAGNFEGLLDPNGQGPLTTYDAMNRPADTNDGDGNHTLVSYYGDNSVRDITDPNLVVTHFNYYLSANPLEADYVTEIQAQGTSDQLVTKSILDKTGMVDAVYVGATELGATRLLVDNMAHRKKSATCDLDAQLQILV